MKNNYKNILINYYIIFVYYIILYKDSNIIKIHKISALIINIILTVL